MKTTSPASQYTYVKEIDIHTKDTHAYVYTAPITECACSLFCSPSICLSLAPIHAYTVHIMHTQYIHTTHTCTPTCMHKQGNLIGVDNTEPMAPAIIYPHLRPAIQTPAGPQRRHCPPRPARGQRQGIRYSRYSRASRCERCDPGPRIQGGGVCGGGVWASERG